MNISNILSSHLKAILIITLVCIALLIVSYVGCFICTTSMEEAQNHYDETVTRYDKTSFSIGCGHNTCKYCKGYFESPKISFSEYVSGMLDVQKYCNDFEYYRSVSNVYSYFEEGKTAFLILTIFFSAVLIVSVACRYKFSISIKERRI